MPSAIITCVESAKSGDLTAYWKTPSGGKRYLHSRVDPIHEAHQIAASLDCSFKEELVIEGIGLGYLVEILLEENPQLIKVELYDPDPAITEILKLFRPKTSLLSDPRIIWHSGEQPSVTVNYRSPAVLGLQYKDSKTTQSRVMYPRSHRPTVIYLKSGYFIERELLAALAAEGIRTFALDYKEGHSFIEQLLEIALHEHPDFLLTVNHFGFDCNGELIRLLEKINLPVASWFVDSPSYILLNHTENRSGLVTPFLWEEAYAERLKGWFDTPVWLPLAGDETRLVKDIQFHEQPGIFVGDSQLVAAAGWRKMLPTDSIWDMRIETGVQAIRSYRQPVWNVTDSIRCSNLKEQLDLESAIVLEATRRQRWEGVKDLSDAVALTVVGDEGWLKVPGNISIHNTVDFYETLPEWYANAAFVVNWTSYQMPTAVNQRIFDVPLCGGYLVTDSQTDLSRLFSPESYPVFNHSGELVGLVQWLLRNQAAAETLRRKQVEQILSNHTYRHRIRSLLRTMSTKRSHSTTVSHWETVGI